MNLFICVDTYDHTRRNLFGFKKKGIKPELRVAAISILSENGDKYSTAISGSRISDDYKWNNKSLRHLDRNLPSSACIDLKSFITTHACMGPIGMIVTDDHLADWIMDSMYQKCGVNKSTYEPDSYTPVSILQSHFLDKLPNDHFNVGSDYPFYIPVEEDKKYTITQKMHMFTAHPDYVFVDKGLTCDERVEQVKKLYDFIQKIKHEQTANK